MTDITKLYEFRFPEEDLRQKNNIWKVLCRSFFQKLVPQDATVLDVACGYGEFINNIKAGAKFGLDINPRTRRHLNSDVKLVARPADDNGLPAESIDVVFTSNFLEHLPDKVVMDRVLAEIKRVLRPGGKFIVMGPNLRYVKEAYWDFYDHHLPLTDVSLKEGLVQSGFDVERVIPRFLPYSTKSGIPQHAFLIETYLRVPLAWQVMGKQFLAVSRKPMNEAGAGAKSDDKVHALHDAGR